MDELSWEDEKTIRFLEIRDPNDERSSHQSIKLKLLSERNWVKLKQESIDNQRINTSIN